MCVHFLELLLLKCTENPALFFKITHKRSFFPEKCPFCYLIIGDYPFFPNKYIAINQETPTLQTEKKTKQKHITLFYNPKYLVSGNSGLPHYLGLKLDRFTLI